MSNLVPIYKNKYIQVYPENIIFDSLMNLDWLSATEARKEYFMADKLLKYVYGTGSNAREYHSSPFNNFVKSFMLTLNSEGNNYNVCFLNRYDSQNNHLGWHADDSVEMDMEHPIAVISFGAEREIWWKDKNFKGEIPKEQRKLLENGSLFVMPAGFQKDFVHRIPKAGKVVGTRISLTFRRYLF